MTTALITGITGQDGSYLAELLLAKGYHVHGLIRRASTFNTERIDHLYHDPHEIGSRLTLHYADLTDGANLARLLAKVEPDEIYNLGAQSHVAVSFEQPVYTCNVDFLGTARLLEALRDTRSNARFYQASTSEMFGNAKAPQNEQTPMVPRSPYAVAKLAAHHLVQVYREAYGLFACCGILFNHESPRRGETFVTRKLCKAAARIAVGLQECVYVGNLNAYRDWGYAPDYVDAMWRMLQQPEAADYVVATGQAHSVREWADWAFGLAGLPLVWGEDGGGTVAFWPGRARAVLRVDKRYKRPAEVDELCGDWRLARERLGWQPTVTFPEIVEVMVKAEMVEAGRAAHDLLA